MRPAHVPGIPAGRVSDTFSTVEQIRVFSVDDHALLRQGIEAVMECQTDMVLVAQAPTGGEAIQRYREILPDVTLMDLRLPDISGIDAMIAIRAEFPDARIMMLTTFEGDVESLCGAASFSSEG
jgi:DNA-binding NarL/FixJ family response regulator